MQPTTLLRLEHICQNTDVKMLHFCYKHGWNKREPMKLNEYLIIYLYTGLSFLLKVVFVDTKTLWKLGHTLTKWIGRYTEGMWSHLDYTLSLIKGCNWTISVLYRNASLQHDMHRMHRRPINRKYISNFVNIKHVFQKCGKDAGRDPKTTSMRSCRRYLQQLYL